MSKQQTLYGPKTKRVALCMMLTGAMALSTGFTQSGVHSVTIEVDGKVIETKTALSTPSAILAQAGVTLDSKDEYTLRQIDDRTAITVRRAVPVTITTEEGTRLVRTSRPTVGDALVELGYNLDDYEIDLGSDTKIQENLDITMTSKAAIAAAEAERERREQEEASRSAQRYADVLTMEATAYIPSDGGGSGITATGMYAQRGVVAVDPAIIPLGSRLYIPGYGEAIAADTGGAINGERIDLCMDTYGEAMEFGRREVTVYVLAS